MGNTLNRLKLLFILVFLVAAGWLWFDQMYNVAPRKECEEKGGWWSPDLRQCKRPLSIRDKETPALTELKRKLEEVRRREKAAPPPAPKT